MTDKKIMGIGAAASRLLAEAPPEPPGWGGEQLSLLPSTALAERGADDAATIDNAGKRGRGRPPGSANKSTTEWAEWIGRRYTNPLVALSEVAGRRVADLAKELNCSTEAAMRIQLDALKTLLPYTNQKMPVALDLGDIGDMQLHIHTDVKQPENGGMSGRGGASSGGSLLDITMDAVEVPAGESPAGDDPAGDE